jgi:hypothetical protein
MGNVSSEVTFNFTSAIRYNKSLLVDGTVVNESMFACPDEGWACPGTNENASVYVTCGCPYTAWVQCALKQTTTQKQQVDFITCWDDQGLHDKKQTNKSLEAAASNCSGQLGLDWDTVRACDVDYSGERAELLFAAATRFMEKWPEYTPMDGPFHVPHVLIGESLSDAEDMEIDLNSTDISSFNDKLCSLEVETGSCGTNRTVVV